MSDEQVQSNVEAPAAGSESPVTSEAAPTEIVSEESVYDTAAEEFFGDGDNDASPSIEANEAETEDAPGIEAAPQDAPGDTLTPGEREVLKKAGLDPAAMAGLDRAKIDQIVGGFRAQQAEFDRFKAQSGRKDEGKAPESAQEPKQQDRPGDPDFASLKKTLVEQYDEGIAPLVDHLENLAKENASLRERTAPIGALGEMVAEMTIDTMLDGLAKQFPSINKPESRQRVIDRFWQEWNTGTYAKPGVSMRAAMKEALTNSAKVTFLNTNEQTAAASLVEKNLKLVASQPKVGASRSRPAPKNEDDVYDQAFDDTIGVEMRR